VKLKRLDQDNALRRNLASVYDKGLDETGLAVPKVRRKAEHVYHLYVTRSSGRDELQERLKKEGIGTLVHYPVPVHLQPAYRGRLRCSGDLAETELAAGEVLSLPLYPELGVADVEMVVRAIRTFRRVSL
jgi:dTDP-4-amino-4,6-dideoxygalactose transaminase